MIELDEPASITSSTRSTNYTISPRTLTLCAAYFHRYTPPRLDGRRLLSPSHVNSLAQWINHHHRYIKTVRRHPILAGHIALLTATNLLIISDHSFHLTPRLTDWLNHSPHDQISYLLQALQEPNLWLAVVNNLGWADILTLDMTSFLEQTLRRQIDSTAVSSYTPAQWQPEEDPETWQLNLPADLPIRLLFDLLQLGHYQPPETLQITPLTIAAPPACHLGLDHIVWLLDRATKIPLTGQQRRQLWEWLQRADAYRIDGPLLSTSTPEQMQVIYQNRRLRPYLLEQISSRHALVDTALVPLLRRWLANQRYPLNQPLDIELPLANNSAPQIEDAVACWLGQRLLLGLQKYVRLPFPPPASQQFYLEQQMEPEVIAGLERLAQNVLDELDTVIAGRDAFFPAWQSPTPQLIDTIEAAIANSAVLRIAYRGIGQHAAEWHEIEPLRLEKRSALFYMHAYSRRAAANRTFRLDRVIEIA